MKKKVICLFAWIGFGLIPNVHAGICMNHVLANYKNMDLSIEGNWKTHQYTIKGNIGAASIYNALYFDKHHNQLVETNKYLFDQKPSLFEDAQEYALDLKKEFFQNNLHIFFKKDKRQICDCWVDESQNVNCNSYDEYASCHTVFESSLFILLEPGMDQKKPNASMMTGFMQKTPLFLDQFTSQPLFENGQSYAIYDRTQYKNIGNYGVLVFEFPYEHLQCRCARHPSGQIQCNSKGAK